MRAHLSGMVWCPMRRPIQVAPSIRAAMRNLPRTSSHWTATRNMVNMGVVGYSSQDIRNAQFIDSGEVAFFERQVDANTLVPLPRGRHPLPKGFRGMT